MAVVKEYQFGGVHVKVADDAYKHKTQSQINESIKQFSTIALSAMQKAQKKSQST